VLIGAFLTREEAAWTLDNRGSLTVVLKKKRNGSTYWHPRYRVVDKNLDALRLLQQQFGGSIYYHSGTNFAWEIAQTTLGMMLEELAPYMEKKRRQAELILQLIAEKENGKEREAEALIVEELRRLNAQN
jgi:folate-dependent tRNA-U54 methylase TrmFO/GidA